MTHGISESAPSSKDGLHQIKQETLDLIEELKRTAEKVFSDDLNNMPGKNPFLRRNVIDELEAIEKDLNDTAIDSIDDHGRITVRRSIQRVRDLETEIIDANQTITGQKGT